MMEHPPGWYPNPADATQLRWWDGNAWTTHTAPLPTWQPGWQVTPTRRRRIWPWIVFPAVGLVLVFGVAAAVFVPRVIDAFKHPIDAANVYLADVRDGRLSAAYAHACIRVYGEMTPEQFVELRQRDEAQNGRLLRFNAHAVHRVAGHGDEAIVDIDMTTTHGRFPIQADMMNEEGHWHWCGYQRVSN